MNAICRHCDSWCLMHHRDVPLAQSILKNLNKYRVRLSIRNAWAKISIADKDRRAK